MMEICPVREILCATFCRCDCFSELGFPVGCTSLSFLFVIFVVYFCKDLLCFTVIMPSSVVVVLKLQGVNELPSPEGVWWG